MAEVHTMTIVQAEPGHPHNVFVNGEQVGYLCTVGPDAVYWAHLNDGKYLCANQNMWTAAAWLAAHNWHGYQGAADKA